MNHADWAEKDFYKALGVAKDADQAAIKKAYRKLARENHPDSKPGDAAAEERFKAIAEAYDVLGDVAKRKEYDDVRAMSASGGFGGFPGGFSGFTRGAEGGFDVSDLFGSFFGGGATRQRAPRAERGADVEAQTTLSFSDAVGGTTIALQLREDAACPTCHGTGGKPGTKPKVCPTCDGAGAVTQSMGGFSVNETCPQCHGRQLIYAEACPTCHGTGAGVHERTIQARIPAGVKDGARIRLKGRGAPGVNGGPAGDLYVVVHVQPHAVFGRKGDALTISVPVAFDEAVLGAEVKVPTLGGSPVTVRIPAGTPSGRVLRVRGRGVKRADGTTGDLLVSVVVEVPDAPDEATRAAAEQLREARNGRDPRAALIGVS